MSEAIQLIEDRPGLPELFLEHRGARLRLSLQGAHITDYAPAGRGNLLWLSESARYERGAAIRGGIPLCWPWFGANPDEQDRPQHGFARTRTFRLIDQQVESRHTAVTLELDPSSDYLEWDGSARLEVEIRLSDHLWMELRTTNLSRRTLAVGAAMHSYFRVHDSRSVGLPALTGLTYRDKTRGFARAVQGAPLQIKGEIDRVYLNPPSEVTLIDAQQEPLIRVNAWGNTDLVIWNPGAMAARNMGDFDDAGYLHMVCIEPALALDRRRHLAPGESFSLGQTLRVD